MTDLSLEAHHTPEDILLEAALGDYNRGMNFFHLHLVELHTNIFHMEKILAFPLAFFAGPDMIFFRQVIVNFYEASVLLITRMATDQDGDLYTLLRFRNSLVRQTKPSYQKALQQRLAVGRFDLRTRDLLQKAADLRNKRIAHITQDFAREFSEQAFEKDGLSLIELKVLRDELNKLFMLLAFNRHYKMLPDSYDESTSDIDRILDGIAKNSRLLNMPEQQPDSWVEYRRSILPQEKIDLINRYRKKLGLPEA